MPTFATPGPIAATVEVAGARVRVTASNRTDTMVLVEPVNEASRSDAKVASKTKVEFARGQLSVKTTTPGDKSGSVAITIGLPARAREPDCALGLADPHHESPTVDVGAPGDVADRDLTGCDVRLQCIDVVQLDLTRCHVQLARAEWAVSVNTRVRQICDQAGARGEVDRDGNRTPLVARDGRLDR